MHEPRSLIGFTESERRVSTEAPTDPTGSRFMATAEVFGWVGTVRLDPSAAWPACQKHSQDVVSTGPRRVAESSIALDDQDDAADNEQPGYDFPTVSGRPAVGFPKPVERAESTGTASEADASVAATDQRLAALLDRAEISELIDRYIVTLDTADQRDRDLRWYRRIFTDDVRLCLPIKKHVGIDGLPELQEAAKLAWGVTHHLSGNHLVELNGDHAHVRAQIVGTHVETGASTFGVTHDQRFDMGGYYDAEAVRTSRGWRIESLRFILDWTSGGGNPRR